MDLTLRLAAGPLPAKLPEIPVQVAELPVVAAQTEPGDALERRDLPVEGLVGGPVAPAHPLLHVDLGLLEPLGEVDEDRLDLGELLDGRRTGLPAPVTGLFDPPERELDLRPDGGRVDVGDPGLEVLDGEERLVDIPGVEGRGEPVVDIVGVADRFLVA